MSAASDYLENKVLDHVLGNTTYTPASTLYVGLWTADDGLESGTITSEVPNANGYARQSITFNTASGGSADNAATVTFPAASGGNWGTITHVAVMDSATHGAGNVIFHGSVTSSKTIDDGDTFQISAGNLTITLA
jgi:hypothetical protein